MGLRHLAAAVALTACASRGPALPEAVALQVTQGAGEPRVLWVAPGPNAWDGPVISQALPGLEGAFRSRLGRVVGAARLVRWVQDGANGAAAERGPLLRLDAPWVLTVHVDGWGLRTGDAAVETFLELSLSLADETGDTVWHAGLDCAEPLMPADVPGAAVVARAVVALDNEQLLGSYARLADTCGARAWAALAEVGERRRDGASRVGQGG